MSYFCQVTNKTVFNERLNKVVVEKREKIYLDSEGNDTGSKGWEVVKEINVCEEGLRILASRQ